MPRRAPRPCPAPGCPTLDCETHKPKPWAGRTGTTRRRTTGYTSGWAEQRANRLTLRQHHGICHVCHQPGADEVDHVIPLSRGGTDDEANRRPIHADPCHRRKTIAEAHPPPRGRTP